MPVEKVPVQGIIWQFWQKPAARSADARVSHKNEPTSAVVKNRLNSWAESPMQRQ